MNAKEFFPVFCQAFSGVTHCKYGTKNVKVMHDQHNCYLREKKKKRPKSTKMPRTV